MIKKEARQTSTITRISCVPSILITLLLIFLSYGVTNAETPLKIEGRVIEINQGVAVVSFPVQQEIAPQEKDAVSFTRLIDGVAVGAGKGRVLETSKDTVRVEITKKPVRLNMSATIMATGRIDIDSLLKEARDNLEKGPDQENLALIQKYADQGNPYGLYYLADCYYLGYGVSRNISKAMDLLNQAIKKGSIEAINLKGLMYVENNGVKTDYKKAFELFNSAAEKGSPGAMNNLGVMYFLGHYVEKNTDTGMEWYHKSAEKGYYLAFWSLAVHYEEGIVVEKDLEKSNNFFKLAAQAGYKPAQDKLDKKGIDW